MQSSRRFGDWRFDADTGDLSGPGVARRLPPQTARLLVFFLDHQNELITRERLIETVWGGRVVSDDAIHRAISILRQTLTPGDIHAFIETVLRKGYITHFPPSPPPDAGPALDPAAAEPPPNDPPAADLPPTSPPAAGRRRPWAYAALGLLVLSLAAVLSLKGGGEAPAAAAGAAAGPSVAVLPFLDLSEDGGKPWLAVGVSDTILHHLAQVRSIRVAARTSAAVAAERELTVPEIARALDVSLVLEGSVQQAGDDVRIIAQLIDGVNGSHLWSKTFRGSTQEVFALQESVARAVLASMPAGDAGVTLPAVRAPGLAAFERIVRGREQLQRKTVRSLEVAGRLFGEAMDLAPDYPLVRTYLAETLILQDQIALGLQDSYSGLPSLRTRDAIVPLLKEALRLDPASGEAKALLAYATPSLDLADKRFREALALAPNHADSYYWYANFLVLRAGEFDRALDVVEDGLALDPLSPRLRSLHARALWSVGLAERARAQLLDYLRDDPGYPTNYKIMARWEMQAGRIDEALRWTLALRRLDPASPSHWGEFGGECFYREMLGQAPETAQCYAAFAAAHPESITARRNAAMADGGLAAAVPVFRASVAEDPGNRYRVMQLANFLLYAGDDDGVLEALDDGFPRLLSDAEIDSLNVWAATMGATAACRLERRPLCGDLLDRIEAGLARHRPRVGGGYFTGMESVEVLALRGDGAGALSALETLVADGWAFAWRWFVIAPSLAPLHDSPRLAAVIDSLEIRMAEQRRRFEARRGEPLF
ncbi:MAG: tetratricopeptide repeat protein [Pseudohaliea sp.]